MHTPAAKQTPKATYLKDYTLPNYRVERVDLRFELDEEFTLVHSSLDLVRNREADISGCRPLILDGEQLELIELRLDGVVLEPDRYSVDEVHLTVDQVPEHFELTVVTRLYPQDNTSLEGLYKSSGNFCTQCEAQGFRKMTYFLDRPDVMAIYTTTLVADKARYPVLLSNGNLIDRGEMSDGRHWATWHDPFKKPCYLFALVAGHLKRIEDTFKIRSGREVALHIYVEPENIDQCSHAMTSLKKAMQWDQETFGLEYDLDIYMIVAIGDFNMGAMENKGLNIFNSKYVLAKPEIATDADYQGIEGVIGHEYFHNWTGNRVTCRDWFQLSLKEGLTLFRDQEFSSDMGSRAVKRISDVNILRSSQFPQDAGPMAHPVRPESYIEINNFYTVTVYNKGAEVIRMIHTLLGKEGFRRGMDLYIQRHDGCAVTCDDFVTAMEDANGADLRQFRRWYSQAGTPEITVASEYDPLAHIYSLKISQSCPSTPGQSRKQPLRIPLRLGLLDTEGRDMPLQLEGEAAPVERERVLELCEPEHVFRFINIAAPPVPSLLRGFSAPVRLKINYTDEDLMFLLAHDSDAFNRWEAAQKLFIRIILGLLEEQRQHNPWILPPSLSAVFDRALSDPDQDLALLDQMLNPPSEGYLGEQMELIDVEGIHSARDFVRRALAEALRNCLLVTYKANHDQGEYHIDARSIARRSLKNRCLDYLMQLDDPEMLQLGLSQFHNATNMTDALGALSRLANRDWPGRPEVLTAFYERWKQEPLVLDKWFTLQATSGLPGTLDEVKILLRHPAFNIRNPNKVRSLIGTFCQGNPVRFHAIDGAGYEFLTEQVLTLDTINPQIAARLMTPFTQWRRYDTTRQALMKEQLEHILSTPKLSSGVYEIASKSLEQEDK